MRVALYHNLPPGGALRVLHEFVRRSRTEHEYDLYTVDLGPFDDFAYARARAEQHDLTPYVAQSRRYPVMGPLVARAVPAKVWRLTAQWWMEQVERRIAADINAGGYDAVLVNSCSVTHSPALLRFLDAPSLYYMNEPRRRSFEAGYQPVGRTGSPVRRGVAFAVEQRLRRGDREAVRAATRVVANSYFTAEAIQRAYGRDATVCYLAVDDEAFDVVPATPRGLSVMSVGSLEAFKGHDLVVRALGLLPGGGRPALDLVYERCDDAYRAEVEALAASSGVELRLHTGISDDRLAGLYRSAATTVVCARLEPFGLVPLESLACGTPVVAVREGGYRETVVHEQNGYLVDRSPAGIADGLSRVLAGALRKTPEELRATVVPRWSWDGAVKRQLEQLALTAAERRP